MDKTDIAHPDSGGRDRLRALIATWRSRARRALKYGAAQALVSDREYYGTVNAGFESAQCADELEAAVQETPIARPPDIEKFCEQKKVTAYMELERYDPQSGPSFDYERGRQTGRVQAFSEVLDAIPPSPSAPDPLRVGSRVWLNEDIEQHNRIVVGTVKSISPIGYVVVAWDEPTTYPVSHFSPVSAAKELKVVTGRDALPRHDWDCQKDQADPPCLRCGVMQTDENEHQPCGAASSSSAEPAKSKRPWCQMCGVELQGFYCDACHEALAGAAVRPSPQSGTDEFLSDWADKILHELSEGEGEHTEALDHSLIVATLRAWAPHFKSAAVSPAEGRDPQIEAFWQGVQRGWSIEPREYFEREAPKNGFKFPIAQALHHIWKRCVKEEPPFGFGVTESDLIDEASQWVGLWESRAPAHVTDVNFTMNMLRRCIAALKGQK